MGVVIFTVFSLAGIFMLPTTINVMIEGDNPVMTAIPGVYTILDCAGIAIAAFLLGISTAFIFQKDAGPSSDRIIISHPDPESSLEIQNSSQNSHQETAFTEESHNFLNLLKGNERSVMDALMKYGEMNQADLSARTGIPKSTLSRTLQNLEDRKLIFRYENGMSKMVKPEIHWNGMNNDNHH